MRAALLMSINTFYAAKCCSNPQDFILTSCQGPKLSKCQKYDV